MQEQAMTQHTATQNMRRTHQAGITLVELAIGIVIIALLLASVLAGKNLSKAGKLRAVMGEIEDHRSGFVRFFDKYGDLPGDMTDADENFNCGACDGNGDERIEWANGEGAMAWRHLQLARMLSASEMSGIGGNAVIGDNVPASKMPGGGYYVDFEAGFGNFFGFGAATGAGVNNDPILRPEDAMNIDLKLDDGNADVGRVRANNRTTATLCKNAQGEYNFTERVARCFVQFQLDNQL